MKVNNHLHFHSYGWSDSGHQITSLTNGQAKGKSPKIVYAHDACELFNACMQIVGLDVNLHRFGQAKWKCSVRM